MPEQKSEFSYDINFYELSAREKHVKLSATPEELAALAARMGFISLKNLQAELILKNLGKTKGVIVKGSLKAKGSQACIISLEPVPFDVKEELAFKFLPEGSITPEMEEENIYTLNSEDLEEIPQDGIVDLGELMAQYMVLSIDPYPRAKGAMLEADPKKGLMVNEPEEKKPNPFAKLAVLRDKS